MELAMKIVGIVVVLCVAVGVVSGLIAWLLSEWNRRNWHRDQTAKANYCRILGGDMLNDHHWFSESIEATEALRLIALGMMGDGRVISNVSVLRDEWRRNCKSLRAEREKNFPSRQKSEVERLQHIAFLIGNIYYYGGFKAETGNERELEALLISGGFRYRTEDEVLEARKKFPYPEKERQPK